MKAAKHFSVTERSTLWTLCFPFSWMGCSQPFLFPFPCPSYGSSCLFRGEQPHCTMNVKGCLLVLGDPLGVERGFVRRELAVSL